MNRGFHLVDIILGNRMDRDYAWIDILGLANGGLHLIYAILCGRVSRVDTWLSTFRLVDGGLHPFDTAW
jgi:hypothetical protein